MQAENFLLNFKNSNSLKTFKNLNSIFDMFYEETLSNIEYIDDKNENKKNNKPTSSFFSLVRSLVVTEKEIENVIKKGRKKKGINILCDNEKENAYEKIYDAIRWNISEDREKELDITLKPPDDKWLSEVMEEENDKSYFENYEDEASEVEFYYYKYSRVLECSFGSIMREFSTFEVNDDLEISEFLISRECFYCKNYGRCFENNNEDYNESNIYEEENIKETDAVKNKKPKLLSLIREGEDYHTISHKVYVQTQTNITNDFKNVYEGSQNVNYESDEYKTDYAETENVDNSRWIEYLNTYKACEENNFFVRNSISKYFSNDKLEEYDEYNGDEEDDFLDYDPIHIDSS